MILSILFFLTFQNQISSAETHKAHVHGAAKLSIAIESPTTASIDLDLSAESIFGFEHEARSAKDKKAKMEGLKKLTDNQIIQFDQTIACVQKNIKAEVEKEESDSKESVHGEHADVNASYSVVCSKPISGTKAYLTLMNLFPQIKTVKVQILNNSNQSQKTIKSSKDSIDL